MNNKQWFVFAIGFFILSVIMYTLKGGVCYGDGDVLVACIVRRYAYAVPYIVFQFLGWIFFICGFMEKK